MAENDSSETSPQEKPRRDFLRKAACTVVGGGITAIPVASGIVVLTDPLRRKSGEAEMTRVTALDALPPDGAPQMFQVVMDKTDAWNRYASVPVGSIYLFRNKADEVIAFHSACPHAGCAVDFIPADDHFFCPCHNSAFARSDGAVQGSSPSARGLDTLETEVRDGEVFVKFQNFKAGVAEKLPIA